ncbi:MAG: excinuclease ABC subunit UvrB [Chitinophagales bacterium]|jgi:excinuclease ABC subunit B|nr:excinuclease ABC subunit UvrB [Sphingobacteriales bacterium]
MKKFKLESSYKPAGDQPRAIEELIQGLEQGLDHQVLLGVTGSGKTFTMANVIEKIQKPTLIITHNKTLVSQLYGEFKQFFPENAVEYFVSYYDYYQPEAYLPSSDTYIEKDLSINQEIEKLRLSTSSSLLSGRNDVLVVASVSCIYGMGNPHEYKKGVIQIAVGQKMTRNFFLAKLVDALYSRTTAELARGNFRVVGDVVEVFLPYIDMGWRVEFYNDEIESIESFNPITNRKIESSSQLAIFPANMYVTPKDLLIESIHKIQDDLVKQVEYFKSIGKHIEAARVTERVNFDIEMMRELGYCSGIENYSRYLDKREAGDRPYCLIDYFPEDFLIILDESHVTIPQLHAMYAGDRARKTNLVEYGFRLPSAMDNRPLQFYEFESFQVPRIYVSATPGKLELEKTEGVIVEQIVRPTGLLDPSISVRPILNQIDDLMHEIELRVQKNERVLVTTLTKRMAEELTEYFYNAGVKSRYIHSEVDTLDRVEILRELRMGKFDVLVGVNLLREGLDLPEVSLVAILDADKEGFLRNERSLTQTAGRAARNSNGLVIFYADKITNSMQRTIDETERRRDIQIKYNLEHGITPTTILKSNEEIFKQTSVLNIREYEEIDAMPTSMVAEEGEEEYQSKEELERKVKAARDKMQKAARQTHFAEAALYRDQMYYYQTKLDGLNRSGK